MKSDNETYHLQSREIYRQIKRMKNCILQNNSAIYLVYSKPEGISEFIGGMNRQRGGMNRFIRQSNSILHFVHSERRGMNRQRRGMNSIIGGVNRFI